MHYTLDYDNRLTDITYPTLHATHFDYDADGRRVDMTDATGTTSWSYGADGVHLCQLASPQGTLTYVYDGDGRLSSKYANVTNVGVVSTWYNGYDNGGRLTSLRSTLDGTTTYAYDAANRLTQKTFGNGNYDVYGYDTCDEVTSIGYYNPGGNCQNGLFYSYDPAGNRTYCNQNWYNTTYGYDGANQLVSETGGGTYAPPTLGYTYDHNGNRLTQTQNGSQTQSFGYDAHDKLVSGTAGGETDTYDPNGSETSITLGGSVYRFVYDDEDRLVSGTYPGATDTFVYNGLGLRVGKTDNTGSYTYFCDGASPGSPVLWDGHVTYTPGLSENRGGTSSYTASDVLGNLWFVDNASAQQTYYQDTSAFGTPLASAGSGSVFGFGGGNGCQTDSDIGLVLMGHRYYDTRIGRFITQDPAGDGDNWYAYCGNDPVDGVDPEGLDEEDVTVAAHGSYTGYWTSNGFNSDPGSATQSITNNTDQSITTTIDTDFSSTQTFNSTGGATGGSSANGTLGGDAFSSFFMQGGLGLNMGHPGMGGGMFAASPGGVPDSSLTTPGGQAELGQLSEDGVTVGKPGNPFKSVEDAVQKAKQWLGDLGKHIENKDGDHVFMNKAGTKKLRFDINNPAPHENPHAHLEELLNGKWKGVGQIYPKDVPPR